MARRTYTPPTTGGGSFYYISGLATEESPAHGVVCNEDGAVGLLGSVTLPLPIGVSAWVRFKSISINALNWSAPSTFQFYLQVWTPQGGAPPVQLNVPVTDTSPSLDPAVNPYHMWTFIDPPRFSLYSQPTPVPHTLYRNPWDSPTFNLFYANSAGGAPGDSLIIYVAFDWVESPMARNIAEPPIIDPMAVIAENIRDVLQKKEYREGV